MNANNSEKLFDWYLIFKELFQKKLEDRSFVDHKLQGKQLENDGLPLTKGTSGTEGLQGAEADLNGAFAK